MIQRQLIIVLAFISIPILSVGQKLDRFEKTILEYEQEDKKHGIIPGTIVFTGSSSIRMWKSLTDDMSPFPVINRGFGGSTIPEVTYYADRIIKPHQPKIIVFYCGENDLSNDESKSKLALKSFKLFSRYMEENLPETKVFFLAIKPSIKRWNYWPKLVDANNKIKKFIDKHDLYYYVDTASEMLDENDVVLQDIFLEDNLHMNDKGYTIWTNTIKPILELYYDKNNSSY